MTQKINYEGWSDCIRLYNAEIELIVTTVIGPRIVRAGYIDGQNFFYLSPDDKERTNDKEWRIYGGHRLWHAPEAMPRSYCPDNFPVGHTMRGHTLLLAQPEETTTGIVKEMEITLAPDKNQVMVLHRLINNNLWDIELSPWALSVLAMGGRAIVPQEPYGEGNDYLLPARSLALWQYTQMQDPRWIWGNKYIQALQDPGRTSEQKIGVLNKQGWSAYCLNGEVLIKRFAFDPAARYPDHGCNNEIYINGDFLEIETLGPLTKIPPKGMVEHIEHWSLAKAVAGGTEDSLDTVILPLVNNFTI
jgi:hypothetical protein